MFRIIAAEFLLQFEIVLLDEFLSLLFEEVSCFKCFILFFGFPFLLPPGFDFITQYRNNIAQYQIQIRKQHIKDAASNHGITKEDLGLRVWIEVGEADEVVRDDGVGELVYHF